MTVTDIFYVTERLLETLPKTLINWICVFYDYTGIVSDVHSLLYYQ